MFTRNKTRRQRLAGRRCAWGIFPQGHEHSGIGQMEKVNCLEVVAKPQLIPWESLELRWSFRAVPNQGKSAKSPFPHINQSWAVRDPGKRDVNLREVVPFNGGVSPWKTQRKWSAINLPGSWGNGCLQSNEIWKQHHNIHHCLWNPWHVGKSQLAGAILMALWKSYDLGNSEYWLTSFFKYEKYDSLWKWLTQKQVIFHFLR